MSRSLRIGWASLAISLVVLAIKVAAYALTGSVALYSDALETVINVVAAIGAVAALWFSELPPDANHPYGHHKAEYLSAVVEGALVLATSAAILHQAWLGWQAPHRPDAPFLGIGLNACGGAINLVWATVLLRAGKARRSPALAAGGRHLMTDVWTTAGVLAGFALVPLTGWLRLDAVVAAVVAANILRTGYGLLRQSVGGLMDEIADPNTLTMLRRIISENADGAIEAHDVRTRSAGSVSFVEFHLVVPGQMTVQVSHEICDRIEAALRDQLGESVISIHVEPDPKAKLVGVPVL